MKRLFLCLATLCLTFSCESIQNFLQEMEKKAEAERQAEIADQEAANAILAALKTEKDRYLSIDEWAINAPAEAEKDLESLAAYLQEKAATDWEKTRAIFIWVGANIEYDVAAYFSSGKTADSALDVLKSRKAVCEGFANMFEQLAGKMGLKAVKISGYCKGYGYKAGVKFNKTDHAWNAVYLDNSWHLFDPTWGGGYIDSDTKKYVKRLENFWFDVPPDEMIYSHLPEDPQWQLIANQVSLAAFEKMPFLKEEFFKIGINARELSVIKSNPDGSGFLKLYNIEDVALRKIAMPLDNILHSDKEYDFKFVSPYISKIVFFNNDTDFEFIKTDSLFKQRIKPNPGALKIGVFLTDNPYSYWILAEYIVR